MNQCFLPDRQRRALSVQVYSLWSAGSCGIGDLGDLRTLAETAVDAGYELLLVSPLHASLPGTPQEPSPYFPSSRQFRNPIYLRVPSAACGGGERVDRDRAWIDKMQALRDEFATFGGEVPTDSELRAFATFNARNEVGTSDPHDVRFHEWVQWRVEKQLAEVAAVGIGLVNDIAVGFDPCGYDAWRWRDLLASGFTVGAPPDAFNADGQNWGVPPFDPELLAAADFAPIRLALRAAFDHAAGIRIDHVMGLFRLFWIPEGGSPADGQYVHYPSEALLDIVAEESQRAGAFVVGEDLGTVEEWIRDELRARNVLSYKVLWFEDDPPSTWPRESLAAVTTHDLPTIAGVASGRDGDDAMRAKLPASLDGAPSLVVVDTLEDVLGVPDRPNHPGADNPWNWSRPLPISVDEIALVAN